MARKRKRHRKQKTKKDIKPFDFDLKNVEVLKSANVKPERKSKKIIINKKAAELFKGPRDELFHTIKKKPLFSREFKERRFRQYENNVKSNMKKIKYGAESGTVNCYVVCYIPYWRAYRSFEITLSGTVREMKQQILDYANRAYYSLTPNEIPLTFKHFTDNLYNRDEPPISVTFSSIYNRDDTFIEDNYRLYGETYNLYNYFGKNIVDYEYEENKCVEGFLKALNFDSTLTLPTSKNVEKKTSPNVNTIKGVSSYLKSKKQRIQFYDLNCDLVYDNNVDSYNTVYASYFKNHIDLLKNKPYSDVFNKYKTVSSVNKIFKDLIKKKEIPSNVKIFGENVIQLSHNNYTYVNKSKITRRDCDLIGIKYSPIITFDNLDIFIENNILKNDSMSFFPKPCRFIKSGFYISTTTSSLTFEEVKDECQTDSEGRRKETIDKNKAYSNELMNLPYLVVVDYKTAKYKKMDIDFYSNMVRDDFREICDHYLYIAKPKKSTILMPNTNMYLGSYIKYCAKHIDFTVTEMLSTTTVPNHFKTLIPKMYEVFGQKAKLVINKLIGKMQSDNSFKNIQKITSVHLNKEDIKGYYMHFDFFEDSTSNVEPTTVYFSLKEDEKYSMKSRIPIATQVMDASRKTVYEKMLELNIEEDDVIQVKVDSITYIKRKYHNEIKVNNEITGWKKEKYKPIKIDNSNIDIDYDKSFLLDEINKSNEIVLKAAGTGKTYSIIKKIEEIENDYYLNLDDLEDKIKKYIILTPTHVSLEEYRKKEFNCDTLQKYSLQLKIPKEEHIIIDEIGLACSDTCTFIYACALKGKKISAYGDFDQLKPFNSKVSYNGPLWIDMMFPNKPIEEFKNYRNNFTKEYYDYIKTTTPENAIIELKKHMSNWQDAEKIITYRNETRKKYALMKLKHLGFKDQFDDGVKYVCKNNSKKKYGIYNNKEVTLKVEDDKYYLCVSDVEKNVTDFEKCRKLTPPTSKNVEKDVKVKIRKTSLKDKNYRLAYATTISSFQGSSCKRYHFAEEDMYILGLPNENQNNIIYTIISRLRS